ncbi:hypothetical protein GCM10007891_23890 [Methylophaga thalassica]|uniref:Peptidase C39 domain-containing protein n=1 Tax=Methylophaga thalassica TaxID=40223 RepID=A0ABQ5U177_9GAMM|nr:hypothetical protein [Methylophaga thalassica]GLQ00536.1 hypothetical protein GCM10007891_23890 [Methylophaga thalassica]
MNSQSNYWAIVQEETTGCGIAACANLAQISYAEAKQLANSLGIYAEDKRLWSETAHIRQLLSALNISVSEKQTDFDSWDKLPEKALIALKWHEKVGNAFWHWAIFMRQGNDAIVIDSAQRLKSPIRTDFGRIKPKWFIEVE